MSTQANQPAESPQKTQAKSWRKIILLCSVGLNFILIGAIIGLGSHLRPRQERIFDPSLLPYIRALEPQHRAALRQNASTTYRDRAKLHHQAIRANQAAVMSALTAASFEPSALREAFAAQRHLIGVVSAEGHERLLALIETFNEQDRNRYAAALARGFAHAPRHRNERPQE